MMSMALRHVESLLHLRNLTVLSCLKLGHLLFSAAESTSLVLQAKDTSFQGALVVSVNFTQAFYKCQRQENEAFDYFFESNNISNVAEVRDDVLHVAVNEVKKLQVLF